MPKSVICLVGPIASGKGTVVEILKENDYSPYSFSDRIKEEIKNRGLEITRFSLNEVSNELRQNVSADIWAKKNGEVIDAEGKEFIVVDGARNPAEVQYLVNKYGAKVMGIVADQNLRFERLKSRGLVHENLTFEEFKELDDRENAQQGETTQQINECLALANITIDNDGTIEELKQKVENFISSFN